MPAPRSTIRILTVLSHACRVSFQALLSSREVSFKFTVGFPRLLLCPQRVVTNWIAHSGRLRAKAHLEVSRTSFSDFRSTVVTQSAGCWPARVSDLR